MDSDYITYRHGKRIEYPYIDFDEDGNPHIITDNGAILYEYARTVTITDAGADSDAGAGYAPEHRSEPTGFAGHDTERDAGANL